MAKIQNMCQVYLRIQVKLSFDCITFCYVYNVFFYQNITLLEESVIFYNTVNYERNNNILARYFIMGKGNI